MPQPYLFRLIDKAIFDYNMIEDGDRILIGASGGKDSTALVHYFSTRKKRPNANFDFTAMHIHSEITPPLNADLERLFKSWDVDCKNLEVDVLGRLKENRKMNCWWCSTQRRTELLNYALKNGFTKLVLGHHLDDILETLLMNMLNKGELSTMPPRLSYRNYPLTIIRPLCYADENQIVQHGKDFSYISTTCTCSYQDNSGRKEARARLEKLTDGDLKKKHRLFDSLKNIQSEYLP